MKFTKIAVAAVFAFAFGNAYAFHSGGRPVPAISTESEGEVPA